ncbi:MAG TPA: glycerophosphodiester phosphodiesterase [Acidimicrobiia bacterium]|nr:glycerophosphodiester phosphodiesterase [Acidimicrobiia bacterium]
MIDTQVIAHRGARRQAPENTVGAFVVARRLGADGVELDVHRTADDRLVVHHDAEEPSLGVLAHRTLAEIQAVRSDVPELDAVLDVCVGLLVNVEIKNSVGDEDHDPTCRAADLLAQRLADRGGVDVVLVSSSDLATIDRVKVLAPDLPTGLLTVGADPLVALETARRHGHQALHPDAWSLADGAAAPLVQAAREVGVLVNTWTVNEADYMVELAEAGVDGLITDVPDIALTALGREPGPPG